MAPAQIGRIGGDFMYGMAFERSGRSVALALSTAALIWSSTICAQGTATMTGITPVDDITVEYGTSLASALERLPGTTTISVNNGDPVPVSLHWQLSEFVETSRGANIVRQDWLPTVRGPYEVTATFALPDGVQRTDVGMSLMLKARVTVESGELLTLDDGGVFRQPGTYSSQSMTFGDTERTYHMYVPSSYERNGGADSGGMPVLFMFHGGGSYAVGQIAYSRVDSLAEREGFIVVAPDYGLSALGRFQTPSVPEFTAAIIDELAANYRIDERRIYATGISMGGGASITLAHELGDRIAAVAPVATGGRGILERTLPRPTTIVWFYGNRDSGYGPQIYETIDHLVMQNNAASRPKIKTWSPTEDDPTSVTRFTYDGGDNGTEVIFYRVEEGGHTWPGKTQYASLISVGLTTQQIDAMELIWTHLKEHSLP